jgi:hypothetical protein
MHIFPWKNSLSRAQDVLDRSADVVHPIEESDAYDCPMRFSRLEEEVPPLLRRASFGR